MGSGGYNRMTTEIFVKKANIVHSERYDYKKTEYITTSDKVIIFCNVHKKYFIQTPNKHLMGQGCKECGGEHRRKTLELFIEQAKIVHNEKYDYSNVKYINAKFKVEIMCKKHGLFSQLPYNHTRGAGCPECAKELISTSMTGNTKAFIEKAKLVHADKYNYDSTIYERDSIKVKIFCNTHQEFFMQTASRHIGGSGCIKCRNKNLTMTIENFIEKAEAIHIGKYSYHYVLYKRNNIKVEIFCNKHKSFFSQTPANHLNGKGCPTCSESFGEKLIAEVLNRLSIPYEREKRFETCRNKNKLPFDFYINNFNLCIEFDGEQHKISKKFFGGEKGLIETQKRDKIKTDWCNKNNIHLLRINYKDSNRIEKILIEKIDQLTLTK